IVAPAGATRSPASRVPAATAASPQAGTSAALLLRSSRDPPLHSGLPNCRSEDDVDGHAVIVERHPSRQLAAQARGGRRLRLAVRHAIRRRCSSRCDGEGPVLWLGVDDIARWRDAGLLYPNAVHPSLFVG